MADSALAQQIESTTTPEQAPAPSQTPAEVSAGDELGGDKASPQSGAPTSPQAQPAQDPTVPWAKFREVQTGHTQLRREYEAAKRQYQGELSKLQQQIQDSSRFKDDYTALEELLNKHPDIAEMLYDRVGKVGGAAKPPAMALSPEFQTMSKDVQEVKALLAQQRQQQAQAEQTASDTRIHEQLGKQTREFLIAKNYNPETFGDDALAYIHQRLNKMADPQWEDVPFILQEWWKREEQKKQHWVNGLRDGKITDQRLPSTPGPTPGAVAPKAESDAFGDRTQAALAEALRSRLGWT